MTPRRVVAVSVDPGAAEALADRLWTLGATGIEERDEDPHVVLVAGYPTDAAALEVASALRAEGIDATAIDVGPDTWLDAWRDHAVPLPAGDRLVVTPAWREHHVGDRRMRLVIDPGRSFGSGTHPTTRLLLDQLDRHVTAGCSVLDVGTGSGILAVAAALLGAGNVLALDMDAEALEVARANVAANGVSSAVRVSDEPLASVGGSFDLVVANLTAATLVDLATDLLARRAAAGALLLSGLLAGQWQHIHHAFATLGAGAISARGGWEAVALPR